MKEVISDISRGNHRGPIIFGIERVPLLQQHTQLTSLIRFNLRQDFPPLPRNSEVSLFHTNLQNPSTFCLNVGFSIFPVVLQGDSHLVDSPDAKEMATVRNAECPDFFETAGKLSTRVYSNGSTAEA